MERTWIEEEGLRRSTDDIEKLRTALAQMLARREIATARQGGDDNKGLVDCLRHALKSVELAKLEVETYDAAFRRCTGPSQYVGSVREAKSPEETAAACAREIKQLTEIEAKIPLNKYAAVAEEIAAEIGKLEEIAGVAGFHGFRVEIEERRVTTQLVLARTAKEARKKAMLKEGVVVDVDEAATSAREPKVYLRGHLVSQAEMDAEADDRPVIRTS